MDIATLTLIIAILFKKSHELEIFLFYSSGFD